MALLIAMNVVLFMIIFWLIGLIMGKEDAARVDVQPAITSPAPVAPVRPSETAAAAPPRTSEPVRQVTQPAGPVAPAKPLSLDASIEQVVDMPVAETTVEEAPAGDPGMVETVRNINVWYDGELVRMEESDNHGNTHVVISNSLKEVDRIAPQDAAYVQALRELKQGSRKHVAMTRITRELAEQVEARKLAGQESVDRFNKVDVSTEHAAPATGRPLTLAERIDSVVGGETVRPRADDAAYAKASLQEYVRELDTESAERANAMRTIRVRRGDSL